LENGVLQTVAGDVLTLTGFVVLAEGLVTFRIMTVAIAGRGLPSVNLSFFKKELWLDGYLRVELKGWDIDS
jgi:hypothetical protein